MLNLEKSPIKDKEIEEFLENRQQNFSATVDKYQAYSGATMLSLPPRQTITQKKNYFNTNSIEAVIGDVMMIDPQAVMIIKSTIPIG